MSEKINVLVVEDSNDDVFFIERELEKAGLEVEIVHIDRKKQLEKTLDSEVIFDVVLTDYNLVSWTGIEVLEMTNSSNPLIPVIVVSGRLGEERAVEVIRKGARDFVSKDDLSRLPKVVKREVKNAWAERRELEMAEKLRESEEMFGEVFNHTPDPIVITERNSSIIRKVNEAFSVLVKKREKELLGESLFTAVEWTDETNVARAVEDVLSGGVLESEELQLEGEDGKRHTVLWSAEGKNYSGDSFSPSMILWIGKDITEKMRADKKMRDSERLRSLGTLSGGIAHDFNNILMVMMGYTEMALDKTDDKKLTRYLGEVYHSVQRARELIRQILAFSRGDEGEPQLIRPASVVKEVLKFLRPSLPSTIHIHEKIDSFSFVYVDPSHIHQIVMNLCTNSYQAMHDGVGTITVGLHDELGEEGRAVRLELSDTGPGIESEHLNRIFEPFFTTKPVGEGTGLGLSVVHGLVETYEGKIEVKSKKNQGTTVTIRIPAEAGGADEESAEQREESLRAGSGKVLVVDDEKKVSEVLALMLNEIGYTAVVRNSPEEALAEVFREDEEGVFFDGILLDLTMPGMNGLELAGWIRKVQGDVPILLCSGYYEHWEEKKVEGIVDGIVPKPIKKADLEEKLYKFIGKKQEVEAENG